MKTIFNIARAELQKLFYSPVAWLVLIIFAFQAALGFTELFERFVLRQALGNTLPPLTLQTFAGMQGLFPSIQGYLYLYIPLITMGVMSREFSSGSIKQLYSSPVTNFQIVLGKYLSLVIFSFTMMAVLGVFSIYGGITIDRVDTPVIFSGLLGVFLLACTYSAVGLFVSSLTSYSVVAAMGTLGILSLLNYIKDIGQEIEFVRDITYWMAISGRANTFIVGLIASEDVLYFLIVISMFLGFTIIKLTAGRQRSTWSGNFLKYTAVFLIAAMLGYCSALPKLMSYLDVTRNKTNTLTKASQAVLEKLDDQLTITTYTNMLEENYSLALPNSFKYDFDRFKQYLRFKPDMKVKYVYYYHDAPNEHLDRQYPKLNAAQRMDTLRKIQNWSFDIVPYSAISDQVDLSGENFRFVRVLERANGEQTFLRVFDDNMRLPSETEISAAIKRLVMKLPVVGFLTGHGERESNNAFDRGYKMFAQEKTFRYAMINQGLDFEDVTLDARIPDHIKILVIAEPRRALTESEHAMLKEYIARGGNLLIAGEPRRQEFINPITEQLGVKFLDGMLVRPNVKFQANLSTLKPSTEAAEFSYFLESMLNRRQLLSMPTAGALEVSRDKGFKVTTLFTSDSTGSWNELQTTDFIDDSASFNPPVEVMQPNEAVVALSRMINNKEQKIIVTGDADWLSNGELGMSRKGLPQGNFNLIMASFYWMSDEEVPVDMRRDPALDRKLKVSESGWKVANIMLKWVFPGILILISVLLLIRRKGR